MAEKGTVVEFETVHRRLSPDQQYEFVTALGEAGLLAQEALALIGDPALGRKVVAFIRQNLGEPTVEREPIESLTFPVRPYNLLRRARVRLIGDLLNAPRPWNNQPCFADFHTKDWEAVVRVLEAAGIPILEGAL